jgi:hypothetical protein
MLYSGLFRRLRQAKHKNRSASRWTCAGSSNCVKALSSCTKPRGFRSISRAKPLVAVEVVRRCGLLGRLLDVLDQLLRHLLDLRQKILARNTQPPIHVAVQMLVSPKRR